MTWLSACALAPLLTSSALVAKPQNPRLVGYLMNEGDGLTEYVKTFDFSQLTHVNIAFENPDGEGSLTFNPIDADIVAAVHRAKGKVLISIGGGGVAEDKVIQARYFDLLSDARRQTFVAKIADYLTEHALDGIDVDIEGPSINEKYGAFLHDLSLALRPHGKLVTAAVSQGYGGDRIPNSVIEDLDFANLMAYDATGGWAPDKPGPHSSIEFAKQVVDYWLGRGLPAHKAVLGVPFYGYGFGKALTKWGYSYSEIVTKFPGAENLDQVGETIYYNGVPTMEAKAALALDRKLGGIMIWELRQDAVGEKSLLGALLRGLRNGSQ